MVRQKFLTVVSMLFSAAIVVAQETEFVETRDKDTQLLTEDVEEYYVLKSDRKTRHGTYVRYKLALATIQLHTSGHYKNGLEDGQWAYYYGDMTNGVRAKGAYVNGKKNGMWTFFYPKDTKEKLIAETFGTEKIKDSANITLQHTGPLLMAGMYLNDKRVGKWTALDTKGVPFQIYDFSNRTFIKDSFLEIDSSNLNSNRPPTFIGGVHAFRYLIFSGRFEAMMRSVEFKNIRNDSASVVISFTVGIDGTVRDITPKFSHNAPKKFINEVLHTARLTGTNWLPALRNSQPVEEKSEIRFVILDKFVRGVSVYTNGKYYWLFASIKDHLTEKKEPGNEPGSKIPEQR